MHTTYPLSGGKVKFEVFDSWNHIWSWFQAWSWTRTCWWENNWDPQVQQWGLSFLYMYMVSSKLPWPKNTQDLKGVRFIPLFSLYSRVYPAFLMFNSISHKDSWVFSLISWKHVAFTTVLCPQAAGWESLVPWLLLRPCAEATKELLGPHSTRHKARAHLHLLGAWGRRYPSSPNTLDGTGTRRWGSLAQTIWKAWFAKAC